MAYEPVRILYKIFEDLSRTLYSLITGVTHQDSQQVILVCSTPGLSAQHILNMIKEPSVAINHFQHIGNTGPGFCWNNGFMKQNTGVEVILKAGTTASIKICSWVVWGISCRTRTLSIQHKERSSKASPHYDRA